MRARIPALNGLCVSRTACTQPMFPSTFSLPIRTLSTTAPSPEEAQVQSTAPSAASLDPNLVSTRREERILQRSGISPIGSRRRRAALQGSANIPFEQLPYQCFQEARKVLQDDRAEKIRQIEVQRARIERLKEQVVSGPGAEAMKKHRLESMRRHLEHMKILADINDPLVKKKFEDGEADMSRPIYRYLAERKWRSRRRLITMQRITQMHVVPDVLVSIDPIADVSLSFNRTPVQPGEFVSSTTSEVAPRLDVQLFDKHERLVSIAVIDADVPNLATDAFDYRCHFLATNVSISAMKPTTQLKNLSAESVVLPWLAPTAQKGSPYHRLCVFILEQPDNKVIDVEAAKAKASRMGFVLRSFVDRHLLQPIGAHMFRTQWDEDMDAVMGRVGEEVSTELRRKRVEKAPYKKKDGARYR